MTYNGRDEAVALSGYLLNVHFLLEVPNAEIPGIPGGVLQGLKGGGREGVRGEKNFAANEKPFPVALRRSRGKKKPISVHRGRRTRSTLAPPRRLLVSITENIVSIVTWKYLEISR